MRMFLSLPFLALVALSSPCRLPPEHWCDTPEIAVECQVYDSCAKFAWNSVEDAPPVKIAIYYESLCPGCQTLIKEQVATAVKQLGKIMDVELVPYGNAEEKHDGSKWVFTCQHGSEECLGNMIETCSMSVLQNFTSYFPFVLCLESSDSGSFEQTGPKCASQVGVNYQPIQACVTSSQGNQLEHQMAAKTDALNPPHQYTPWVVVNGKHTEILQRKAQANLVKLVCRTYTGPKPVACNQFVEEPLPRCF